MVGFSAACESRSSSVPPSCMCGVCLRQRAGIAGERRRPRAEGAPTHAPSCLRLRPARKPDGSTAAWVERAFALQTGAGMRRSILLAFRRGLRAAELCDLCWDQVEFSAARHWFLISRRRARRAPTIAGATVDLRCPFIQHVAVIAGYDNDTPGAAGCVENRIHDRHLSAGGER
jgi:hypothetical protein